jgi:hypothetical protein
LTRKYPYAAKEWGCQYVFPNRNLSVAPRAGLTRRHHTDLSVINKTIKVAASPTGLTKSISTHTFRHSFPKLVTYREPTARQLNPTLVTTVAPAPGLHQFPPCQLRYQRAIGFEKIEIRQFTRVNPEDLLESLIRYLTPVGIHPKEHQIHLKAVGIGVLKG